MKNFDQLHYQKECSKHSLLNKSLLSRPFSGQFCSGFLPSKKSAARTQALLCSVKETHNAYMRSFIKCTQACTVYERVSGKLKHAAVVQSTEQNYEISSLHQNSKFKTNQIKKKLLNGYSKIHELKLVTIDLASPEKIQSWAEKELPNGKIFGEVTNANTFHYRTFKPSKGGLFCERIFGPIKDFECACGKRQKPTALESRKILEHEQTTRSFCPNCDVEYTWSILRRYQLGYIKLNAPVAHLWYFKTNPSYLSILFDMKRKHLESIIYCTETITIENTWKYSTQNSSLSRTPKDLYLTWQKLLKMEEKLQKYQRMYENKQEKQKQKKSVFRNLSLTQNKISPQLNWQNVEKIAFPENSNNIEAFEKMCALSSRNADMRSAKGTDHTSGTVFSKNEAKIKSEILFNISKQKQKKFVFFLFEEIWKNFLKKTYKNALVLTYSQQYPRNAANDFFQNMNTIFNIFLFSSKKNTKFYSFSEISFDLELLNKEISSFKMNTLFLDSKKKSNSFQNNKPDQTNLEEKQKKNAHSHARVKYWKSLFFLLEFASFFLYEKNKKQKNFHSISKKDFLFLMNLLPFLKQILKFKTLNFQKENSQKIHSFILQNLSLNEEKKEGKQSTFTQNTALYSSARTPHNLCTTLFQIENEFEKIKASSHTERTYCSPIHIFLQENFEKQCIDFFPTVKINTPNTENKISSFLELNLSPLESKNEKNSSAFNQVFNRSLNFQKLFTFLKSYYEVDFCSVIQKESFINGQDQKNFFIENLNKEQLEKFVEKNSKAFFIQSQVYPLYEKVCLNSFSFFLYVFQKNRISIFKNNFQNFSELFVIAQNKKYFCSRNLKIEESLFFSLKYTASLFFLFSEFKQNKTENKYIENLYARNKFQRVPQAGSRDEKNLLLAPAQKKNRIFISNRPFVSREEFNKKKKEIANEQIQKFFQADLRSKKVVFTEKRPFVKNKIFIFKSHKEQKQTNENNYFLKNRICTLAYNYPWSNDADWKYFVYYNSLFLYEFDDNPIFIYRSLFPFKGATNNQIFSTLENTSMYQQKNFAEPYSFLSLSLNSFPGASTNFFLQAPGAGIIEKLLAEYTSLELRKMTKQHQILLPRINGVLRFLKQGARPFAKGEAVHSVSKHAKIKKDSLKIQKYFQKREHIIRRLKFLRKFSRRNSNPTFMILKNLPVLPPDLRPILKLQNQIAASDLNRFYQRIIYRNDRLKKFSKDSATNASFEMKYAQRLLQEAVDNLIQNGKGSVKAETNSRGQPLKSLSEILKGKQGRFRQYLLGKRVDYSGRSVIVVGPELKLYECGLPREMALELFLPFLIQYVLHNRLAKTVIGAKNLLKADSNLTLHLLHKVMKNIPVLLNRAPTLHRLGFQAFLPKLIEGRAILLHPMVCPAFNADFDGDQMAVHIPLTVEARTEAWKFMLSTNNLMNSATGEAIVLPSQDMVLGCYYLTMDFQSKFVGVQLSNSLKKQNFQKFIVQKKAFLFFNNFTSVLTAYQKGEISLHTPVWVNWNAAVDFGNELSKPVEIRLQTNGSWQQIQPKYTTFFNNTNKELYKTIRTTPGRILMNFMIQECSVKNF